MLNQLKLILDELFKIWHWRYQPTQLYLWMGFSLPAQALFFLICMGDSTGKGYRLCVMPRPDLRYEAVIVFIFFVKIFKKHIFSSSTCELIKALIRIAFSLRKNLQHLYRVYILF